MQLIQQTYIIDDDQVLVMLVKLLVKKHPDYETCQEFTNGKKAFDYIKSCAEQNSELPDLILLDINMPVMDGWEFLEELEKLNLEKEIPVYIVTSSIDPSDKAKAQKFPMVKDYILKPVTIEKLSKIHHFISS